VSFDVTLLTTALVLAAVVVAWRGAGPSARRSEVAARLRTLYGLVAALLLLRIIVQTAPHPALGAALMGVAAWLPLAALRLVEELRRRHAPRLLKLVGLGGGGAFTILALSAGLVWSSATAVAIAAYQALMVAAIVVLLSRERSDLGPAERRTADALRLALLLAIPLALTDFHALFPDLPVRGGAFAVLVLLLTTSRLASGSGSARQLASDFGLLGLAGGFAVLTTLTVDPHQSAAALARIAAAAAAMAALLLLVERFASHCGEGRGLIRSLAAAPNEPDALLSAHPLLASARVLGPEALADYPAASLRGLASRRVISRDLPDPEGREAAGDLLEAAGATHLVRLSQAPLRFLAVAAGDLAAPALDDELEIVARLVERSA
jgi:hypothetical protein